MKSVLLLIVDALASRVVVPALERGALPHLAEVIDQGTFAEESVAVFLGRLRFTDYPNAFERIAGGFGDQSGSLWLTARPGHEFGLPQTTVHPGGSHGSLHAFDSISPLILGGAPPNIKVPPHPRAVDVLPLCLQALGIERQLIRG